MEIERLDPSRMFWESYEQFYRDFDVERFNKEVLSKFDSHYGWTPDRYLTGLGSARAKKLRQQYDREIGKLEQGVTNKARWGPEAGLPKVVDELIAEVQTNLIPKSVVPFTLSAPNPYVDISEKPADFSGFHKRRPEIVRLRKALRPNAAPLSPGRKILWANAEGILSPEAVILSRYKNGDLRILLEEPKTGQVVEKRASLDEVLKFNNPEKQVQPGVTVAGTRLELTPEFKRRREWLRNYLAPILKKFPTLKGEEAFRAQREALFALMKAAASSYEGNLPPEEKEKYQALLKQRLSGQAEVSLEQAMLKGCGNCMDQTLFTSMVLDEVAQDLKMEYQAVISRASYGAKHWSLVVTLHPSQEQYVVDSSFAGPRVFSLRHAPYHARWPFHRVLDQFGARPGAAALGRCERGFAAIR